MSRRNHLGLMFNNVVNLTAIDKHLGMILDSKLKFDENFKSMLIKISKTVGVVRKFQGILPRTCLLTTYKSFARPHLDYDDIYGQAFNESFYQRVESIHNNAAIALTCAIRGTSSEKA